MGASSRIPLGNDVRTDFLKKCVEQVDASIRVLSASSQSPSESTQAMTQARAAIERIAGSSSIYAEHAKRALRYVYVNQQLDGLLGVMKGLKQDLEGGYLYDVEELIHGELFGDFLEMASHLLKEGYKDAAAVIAGGALEAHLRQLCHRADIETQVKTAKGIRPKKAESMNAELAKADASLKGDQKNLTAWLDLRNNAAHGHYDEYQKGEVSLMIAGIRDFIGRNPA